ncbi:rhodanese-like domain-containing protein [Methanobacterium paludis]|uniref:Rhodanese-like protein n=1 Tax=Methanobacterium paludis (strain DSM 25820 / JCM 18151 / SWAN1) TaxID=868131 RepID=F6D5Z4_METPW|nr:rhodanese-like domain-containing protein [Methanobacterium paludis]AEG19364.1 Rhodanese-like protein [Methanobacterium paludis]
MSEPVNPEDQLIINITPLDAIKLIENSSNDHEFILIDLRTPKEFSKGHVEGAENLDYYADDFKKQLDEMDKDKKYIIYCGSGVRGTKTSKIMMDMGFMEVYNILGGFAGWKITKLPVAKE